MTTPDPDSIRLALDKAWQDHHHTRDQTWKSLQIEAALVAGLIGIDWQLGNVQATVAAGLLVIIAAFFGMRITIQHRNKVECKKFEFITKFEEALGIDSIVGGKTQVPEPIRLYDAFNYNKNNTALFILRMHIAIFIFSAVYLLVRIFQ